MVELAREIWLLRHGATEFSEQGRYCGQSDPPLSPQGREELLPRRADISGIRDGTEVTIVIYDLSMIVGETPDTVFYDQLPPVNKETRFYYVITAFDNQGNQSYPSEEIVVMVTGMSEHPPKGYDGYRLLSNYPNPFNPSTVIP